MSNKKLAWRLFVIIGFWIIIPIGIWIAIRSWKIDNLGYRIIVAVILAYCMWSVVISIFWFIKGFLNEWNRLGDKND